jgi:hypothetical protein
MADHALFVGWGEIIPGREQQAAQVFNELLQHYGQLQQQGEIEGFEPFFLEPHGGDLGGFLLLRGDRDKLARVRASDEFVRLNQRAQLVVQRFGVVGAVAGQELQRQVGLYQQQAGELAR